MHLPRPNRQRNLRLFVDSGSSDEPDDRWFASLTAALSGFRRLDDRWKPYAWIIEYHEQHVIGGIPTVRNVVHLRRGKRIERATHNQS
jgi:hypothetical protein